MKLKDILLNISIATDIQVDERNVAKNVISGTAFKIYDDLISNDPAYLEKEVVIFYIKQNENEDPYIVIVVK